MTFIVSLAAPIISRPAISAGAITPSSIQIVLSTASTGPTGVSNYVLNLWQGPVAGVPLSSIGVTPRSFPYVYGGLAAGTAYSFQLTAVENNGSAYMSAASLTLSASTGSTSSAPPQVTWLTVPAAQSSSSISMAWNPDSTASNYDIERNGTLIQAGYTSTSFTDTGLLPSTSYTYKVAGVNASGAGPYSVTESATTQSQSSGVASASGATSALYTYLKGLAGTGKILSGQHEEYDDSLNTMATIHSGTGQYPAICGTFAKLSGVTDDAGNALGSTAAVSNTWLAKGGIVLCTWAPPDPADGAGSTSYPNGLNAGNFPNCYLNNGSAVSNAMNAMIDTLSTILKDIDGTVILRPWPEMTGTWFWYASTPTDLIALWRYTFNRVVNINGVTNALWLWNVNGMSDKGGGKQFYPGDAYVDLVSFEGYTPNASMVTNSYNPLVAVAAPGNKPCMFGECGSIPDGTQAPNVYDIYNSLYKYTQANMPKIIAAPDWGQSLAIPQQKNWQAVFSDPTIIRLSDLPPGVSALPSNVS